MKTKLGTILPTKRSLAATESYVERVEALKAIVGRGLIGCDVRRIGGETRHYAKPDVFAVVKGNGKVIWFETRGDGYDYAISTPRKG